MFAVATVLEGIKLREAGITQPILVLAEPPIEAIPALLLACYHAHGLYGGVRPSPMVSAPCRRVPSGGTISLSKRA